MNRLLFLFLFALLQFSQARMVDGIALIVENEPITTAEIRAIRSQMGISKSKATDLLIQDRLQKIAMKDIVASEEEVDAKIAEIAKLNKLSIPKMQKILKRQGTTWVNYRAQVREGIKKARFYQEVVVASIPEPSEDELKLFYNEHKKEFTIPRSIKLMEYSAKEKKTLETRSKGIQKKRITKQTDPLGLEMLSMFLQTPRNRYTKILNAGDKYIMYKVIGTHGKRIMPFEMAQTAAIAKWKQAQQTQALKDYFEKLRTRSDIQILR